jgi:AcrR family transcriptional regulator
VKSAVSGRAGTKAARSAGSIASAVPIHATPRQPAQVLGPRANRTIARILAAATEIFLVRGYGGTTIDEIARVAGLSRASFYSYFPSKRELLLTLGANHASEATEVVESLRSIEAPWRVADIEDWVRAYFALLETHGSFSFAWTQAAHEDEEIRRAGMRRHLNICRRLGAAMGAVRGAPFPHPREQGLLTLSMLERSWSYCRLYAGTIDPGVIQAEAARMIASVLECSPSS